MSCNSWTNKQTSLTDDKCQISLKDKANNWQKDKDYFCSELCYAAFYFGGGLDIAPDVPEADITSPGDIAKSSLVEHIARRG